MEIDLGDFPCVGYDANEIDFPQRHAQLSPQLRELIDVMIEPAVTAESDPSAGRFCFITIVGHADRVDTPGLSSEARRAMELENSTLRAESAQAFFFSEIFKRLQDQGFTHPVDLGSLLAVEIQTIACGAADLLNPNPGNDMEQRKENRRVQLIGTMVTPG